MNPPPVSILMPVYNCEPFLDAAIRSMRTQTFTDFEFVIVNDGSTDDSLKTISRHAAEDERIVVVDRPNGGIVTALNTGLDACRAKYVARMDGDDLATPDRLRLQVADLEANPDRAVVGGQVTLIDADGRQIGDLTYPCNHVEIDQFAVELGRCGISHPASTFRRSALMSIGGYRDEFRFAEDLDLYLRLGEKYQLANLDSVVLYYRRHQGTVAGRQSSWQSRSTELALRSAMKRRGQPARQLLATQAYRSAWRSAMAGEGRYCQQALVRCWRDQPFSTVAFRSVITSALVLGKRRLQRTPHE